MAESSHSAAPKDVTARPAPATPAGPASQPHVPKVKVAAAASVPKAQAEAERESFGSVRKSVAFLAAVAAAYLAYLVFTGQIDEFVTALGGISRSWVVAGMVCYLVYYVLGVLAYVTPVVGDPSCPVGLRDLMSVEAAGIFFSNLTPNGAGGAPAQIFRLTRAGLSVGGAGALQYTRFIVYEAAEGIFAAIMLVFRYGYFVDTYGDVFLVGAFLFGFKILEVGALLLACLSPRFVARVGNSILDFLNRRGRLKNYDHWHEVINGQVMDFSEGFKTASKNVAGMLLTLALTLVQLGCLYALPYFVLRAFGQPANLLTCLACGSMLELLTSAVPLPGGTFGAEGGFAFLFAGMFNGAVAAGYVVWRMLEYFLPTLVTVPLLGLRSGGHGTLHDRWWRLVRRLGGLRAGKSGTKVHAGEIRVPMGHQQGQQRHR